MSDHMNLYLPVVRTSYPEYLNNLKFEVEREDVRYVQKV